MCLTVSDLYMWPKFAEIIAEIEISKSKMAENIFVIRAGITNQPES